jgi:hypothetical protein
MFRIVIRPAAGCRASAGSVRRRTAPPPSARRPAPAPADRDRRIHDAAPRGSRSVVARRKAEYDDLRPATTAARPTQRQRQLSWM